MDQVLSLAEMQQQFQSEWILVGDPVTDASNQVQSGRVIAHSKDRDEVYRRAVTERPERFAILYTGQLPKDAAVVL